MKKTVIIILAILPIVLLVMIGVAGQALKPILNNPVKSIAFMDEVGTPLTQETPYPIKLGTEKQLKDLLVFNPLNANDQEVKYTVNSEGEGVCTVDENGILHAIAPGTATITAISHDGNKEAFLYIIVKAEVIGISLPFATLDLTLGESVTLTPTVQYPEAPTADKKVSYISSDPSVVSVDKQGNLKALKEGTVIITLMTVNGKYSTTCTVTVTEGILPISFDFSSADWIYDDKGVFVTSQHTLNLNEFVRCNPELVEKDQIQFYIKSGSSRGSLANGVLTLTSDGPLEIIAYVGDKNNPTYYQTITIQRI